MSEPTIRRSRHEVEALELHAAAQAATDAKRKSLCKPRRDDLARAAYYVLLALYADPGCSGEQRKALQLQIMTLMRRAGFDLIEANAAFVRDAAGVEDDLDAWLCRRWIEEGRRLGDGRDPYRSKLRKGVSR